MEVSNIKFHANPSRWTTLTDADRRTWRRELALFAIMRMRRNKYELNEHLIIYTEPSHRGHSNGTTNKYLGWKKANVYALFKENLLDVAIRKIKVR
jgi:hypothetical protein